MNTDASGSSEVVSSDDSERYDDDVLAAAMADEAVRLGLTGAIQTMPPPASPAVSTPLPPPMARAVATGPGAPAAPSGPIPRVAVTPIQPISFAEMPAPSGEPIVFEKDPPRSSDLPTRRSLRDAEHARIRENNSIRVSTSIPPLSASHHAPPTPGASASPKFFPAPDEPDSEWEHGDTAPVSTAAAVTPPSYELVEPDPHPVPVPGLWADHHPLDEGVAQRSEPSSHPATVDSFASLIAGVGLPTSEDAITAGSSAEDFEAVDEAALAARTAASPWLRSEIIAAPTTAAALKVFTPEGSGSSPTPLEARLGRASRLFWLWFAANSSVMSLAFGSALFSLGMSLRQAVVATFVGVAISFLPLGLGTLAGKWSGQPVMVVSRATFGHFGNILPAAVALLTRVFWGAVLLWIIAAATARIVVGAKLGGPLTEMQLMVIVMALGFLLALVVAYFGYALFARIQRIVGILSAVLIVVLVVITLPTVDLAKALTVRDGPVMLVITGVVLVFSFVGLVWANSSGDLARYQRPSSSGGASMLWASFGTTLPAFLLIGYGAVLAASSEKTARGLVASPIDTIAGLLPSWYPVPLIAATALSLLSGVILSIYSGGFALGAIGLKVHRSGATVIVGVLVFAVAVVLGFTVSDVVVVFRDLATTLAVPVAAWAGIFSAEMMLRRRRFDTRSLLTRGGIYRDVNWLNLTMLIVASVIGLGLTSASVVGLRWEGYLFTAAGVRLTSPLGSTDLGVLVALAIGLLTPLVAGISTIRNQELRQAARV